MKITLDSIKNKPYGYWVHPTGEVTEVDECEHLDTIGRLGIDGYTQAFDMGMVRVASIFGGRELGFSFRGAIVSGETIETMIRIIDKHYYPDPNDSHFIEIFWQDGEETNAKPEKISDERAAKNFLRSFLK